MKGDIGYIYLLSNPALGGMVKIGHTKKVEAELRAAELSASTSIPLPFKVESSWLVEYPSTCESRIHRRLSFCRVSKDREFFQITPEEAENHINQMLYGTEDALWAQLESIVSLYRKYPDSFKKADKFIAKLEFIISNGLPA